MPPAARVGDPTGHPGVISPPGVPTVLIGGMPAATVGTPHICSFPPPAVHPPSAIVPPGSSFSADTRRPRSPSQVPSALASTERARPRARPSANSGGRLSTSNSQNRSQRSGVPWARRNQTVFTPIMYLRRGL